MEGLENLEKVQMTIQLLHSIGISDENPDSERFLAQFTLLLKSQQCGELDIAAKCRLISEHMSKILSLCLGDASQCGEKDRSPVDIHNQLYSNVNASASTALSLSNDGAMVGMDAMIRSNSTLEDFCRSYFMFHKMEVNHPQSMFRYLPMLFFTESYIYQLDGLNEKLLPGGLTDFEVTKLFRKLFYVSDSDTKFTLPFFTEVQDSDPNMDGKSIRVLGEDPFRPLLIVLERHGLLTERITEELKSGEEYWALERKLCCSLVSNKKISIEDVTRAIHLKSFDYRVLNLLLYQLRGEKVNELHMEFLSISELLVEVSDDLFDYEDDVAENNFNVLRMFVRYYGASAAPIMLRNVTREGMPWVLPSSVTNLPTNKAKFIAEAEEKYDQLFKALGPELSKKYQERCEEATKEGGKMSGPSLGTWHLPPIIEDETGYRMAFSSSTP